MSFVQNLCIQRGSLISPKDPLRRSILLPPQHWSLWVFSLSVPSPLLLPSLHCPWELPLGNISNSITKAPPSTRRVKAQSIFLHSCCLCVAGWKGPREGAGGINGLKQPLVFIYQQRHWLFPLPERLLTITLPLYDQQTQPWSYCQAGFSLYWKAFHSQFSLGQTRERMHLKQNKMWLSREEIEFQSSGQIKFILCSHHLQIRLHSLTVYYIQL